MITKLPNIILIGNSVQRYEELVHLYKQLSPWFKFTVVIFEKNVEILKRIAGDVELNYIVFDTKPSLKRHLQPRGPIWRITEKLFSNFSFYQMLLGHQKFFMLNNYLHRAREIIQELNPICVVTTGDRHDFFEQPLLLAAKEKNLTNVIVYFCMTAAPWVKRFDNPLYCYSQKSSWFSKYYFAKFSDQVTEFNGKRLSFYKAHELYAYHKLGSLSKYAWWIGNGLADIVCVDSKYNEKRYTEIGKVDKKKLRILGDFSNDRLCAACQDRDKIKRELIRKYSLNEGSVIFVGMPQYYEEGEFSFDEHWAEIDFLLNTLKLFGQNVLVSLHPKMDHEVYSKRIAPYNYKVLEERLIDVLPAADGYIATNSSTVYWAILARVNSLIMGFKNIDCTMFEVFSSVRIAKDHESFRSMLTSLTIDNRSFINDWQLLSRDTIFRGKTAEKYRDLLMGFTDV